MKVSVSITTYNHEDYVAHAIESVLMQKTDFDYEIIIGEDDSKDNTRAIVKEYKKCHPDKIKLFLNDRSNVIYVNGRPTGRWNFVNNLTHARGEYIALLDGDDYWKDPCKLQKQVDFLDSHPECAICFHDVIVFWEDGSRESRNFCRVNQRGMSTLEDLLAENFIPTCSVMFRRGLFSRFPDWYYTLEMGDWPLHVLNAEYGKIGYLNEAMGAYRIHDRGVWSTLNQIQNLQAKVELYKSLGHHLKNLQYRGIIKARLSNLYLDLAREYETNGNLVDARSCALNHITERPSSNYIFSSQSFTVLLRLYVPMLYRLIRTVVRSIYFITEGSRR